ncbi:L,D-transpeptidase family protein [Brumimicrobium mesophilum]|uniref:L,D-transpeptidase family protein n=1 Tax=Brumimicrobium mesophilum TaxID=392717 RepID=UPI000D13F9B6|nr:L,D-transpeptidase family protein [Brumimicrobium mesophilum]
MKTKYILFLLAFIICAFNADNFKQEQLKYPRVREAYQAKKAAVLRILKNKDIEISKLQIYIRAFKSEKEVEIWAKNSSDNKFQLIKTYDVCRNSGVLGPKRKQGDLQVPEGFYHIDRFNPYSSYHLSLGINYPNKSDRILGTKGKLGGDIFIHGKCVTIGCLPMTNEFIKEIYIICVEARNNGQTSIPVTIFPLKLSDKKYDILNKKYAKDLDKINLWKDLKVGYDIFNETNQLFSVGFLNSGRHNVR